MARVDTRWLGADGTSAPFFAAAGIAPSKDNWWSTPDQPKPRTLAGGPTPCDGGNRNVTNNFLHALVATLSTGPVGFSDALGYTNASLVRSTCASDGLLLKPSLPLAAIDRTFSVGSPSGAASSSVGPPVPAGGHVWATHTRVGSATYTEGIWYSVLAITVHSEWSLLRSDLWPPLDEDADVVVWDWGDVSSARLVKANTSELASLQTAPAPPLPAEPTPRPVFDFTYKLVAPMIPTSGGWALLGEPDKLTPVSEQRQWSFDLAEGFLLKVEGAVGENVTVAAWKGGQVHTHSTVIGDNGEGAIIF